MQWKIRCAWGKDTTTETLRFIELTSTAYARFCGNICNLHLGNTSHIIIICRGSFFNKTSRLHPPLLVKKSYEVVTRNARSGRSQQILNSISIKIRIANKKSTLMYFRGAFASRVTTSNRSTRQDSSPDAPLSSPIRLRVCLQSSILAVAYKASSSISMIPLFTTLVVVDDTSFNT